MRAVYWLLRVPVVKITVVAFHLLIYKQLCLRLPDSVMYIKEINLHNFLEIYAPFFLSTLSGNLFCTRYCIRNAYLLNIL